MTKAETVLQFYETTHKLKTVIRSGWKIWHVKAERLESIAEHIYGVQMLALAMYSEYNYDIDLAKVSLMLACHELEEIAIGDLTPFDKVTAAEKQERGHAAVAEILKPLMGGGAIMDLVLEFDAHKTAEAKFAYHCDKLEAGLQAYLYDQNGEFGGIDTIVNNPITVNEDVKILIEKYHSLSAAWLEYWNKAYADDPNFLEVSDFAKQKATKI